MRRDLLAAAQFHLDTGWNRQLLEDMTLYAKETIGRALTVRPEPRTSVVRAEIARERGEVFRVSRNDVVHGMPGNNYSETVRHEHRLRSDVLEEEFGAQHVAEWEVVVKGVPRFADDTRSPLKLPSAV